MRHSVAIRVDGSHQIGTGHLARALRLAGRFRQSGSQVTLVTRPLNGCADMFDGRHHEYEIVLLPPISEGPGAHAASTVCALGPDLILNDVRDTSNEYMAPLRTSGAQIVNFDDRGSGAALADVLVDANRLPGEACEAPNACALFGPDYIVLDAAFERAHGQSKPVRERVGELLVFMGGSDPAGLTLKALEALELLGPQWHTTVVLGYGFKDHAEAGALAARCRNVELVAGPAGLADRMQAADMALCSGGIAMFELACVGTPSIVWCQVPHELHNARLFSDRGIVRCLGLGSGPGVETVAGALAQLADDVVARRAMSQAGKTAVDGRGLDRVMEGMGQCVQHY